MIPTSAFRETLILILFGIVLVPIAAKRAQDAPGYWQTFSKELSSLAAMPSYRTAAGEHPPLWGPPRNDTAGEQYQQQYQQHQQIACPPGGCGPKREMTRPGRHAKGPAPEPVRAAGAPKRTRNPLTVRFRVATSEQESGVGSTTATTGGSGEAQSQSQSQIHAATATPAPAPAPVPVVESSSSPAEAPVTNVKESDASRGRWTLIWAGSAIAAVAVFFSSC